MLQCLGACAAHEMCQIYHWHEVINVHVDMGNVIMFRRFVDNMNRHKRIVAYLNTILWDLVKDMLTFY